MQHVLEEVLLLSAFKCRLFKITNRLLLKNHVQLITWKLSRLPDKNTVTQITELHVSV